MSGFSSIFPTRAGRLFAFAFVLAIVKRTAALQFSVNGQPKTPVASRFRQLDATSSQNGTSLTLGDHHDTEYTTTIQLNGAPFPSTCYRRA
jgi:hypothetical protein